jgi:predicted ATPase/DNA-binding winged helix-turn-helix (wHTH) protein
MNVDLASSDMFVFGPFRLVPAAHLLFENDRPLRVGGRALDILQALVERAGDVVSNQELMTRVWGDTAVEDGNLRVHITALRKTLSDGKTSARYIANVPGRGYSFVAPVARTRAPEPPVASVHAVPAVPSSHRLPATLTKLIGRDRQLSALLDQLAVQRLVTLVGPGGIGKTTMALAVAAELGAHYADGVRFIELGSIDAPERIASAIANGVELASAPDRPAGELTSALADMAMLLVLDNCEHLVDEVAAFAERILRVAPGIRILATSREPLRIEGEWICRLLPLELPPATGSITAAEALGYPGVELFVARVAASVDGFELSDGDAPIICDICRQLDGIPLAIELAAARVEALGARGLRAQLDASAGLSLHGRRTVNPRQRTLRAMLDWSNATLSPQTQIILRRLSVFRGPFTLDSAATVAAGEDISAAEVFEGVIDLTSKSLLTADVRHDVVTYRMLEMTRAYAAEKLVAVGEHVAVARLHAAHQCELFAQAPGVGRGPIVTDRATGERWRLADVRAALDASFADTGDREVGVALTVASMPLWFEMSLLDEYRAYVTRALAQVRLLGPQASPIQELQLLLAHSQLLIHTVGAVDDAKAAAIRALEIAEAIGVLPLRLQALGAMWVACFARAEYAEAADLAQRFAAQCGTVTSLSLRLVRDMLLAGSHYHWGRYDEARRLLEPMLQLPAGHRSGLAGVCDVDGEAAMLAVLARTLWIQGFPVRAKTVAHDCVARAQASRSAASLCFALGHAALPVAIWSGDQDTIADRLAMLIREAARHRLGGWSSWGRTFERALGGGGLGVPNAGVAATHTMMIGTIDPWLVDTDTFARADNGGAAWCAPEILRARALQMLAQRSAESDHAAAALLTRAIELASAQGALSWQLRAATSLSRLRRDQGRRSDARAVLEGVYRQFTEGLDTADLVAARAVLDELSAMRD